MDAFGDFALGNCLVVPWVGGFALISFAWYYCGWIVLLVCSLLVWSCRVYCACGHGLVFVCVEAYAVFVVWGYALRYAFVGLVVGLTCP